MPETFHQSQFYFTLDGADAPEPLIRSLMQLSVETSVHLPSVATLVLNDPALKWVDDKALEPGRAIRVLGFAGATEKPLFDGEIVEIEPEFGNGNHRLTVRAFDRLHRLSRGSQVRSFQNVTDADLVQKLAQEAGLKAEVGPASQVHPYVLQANQSNLEFLRGRAAALGFLLYAEGTTLHCAPPKPLGQPVDLQWNRTLREFRPRMTTLEQVTSVTVRGWDPAQRREIVGTAKNGKGAPQVGEKRTGGQLVQAAFKGEAPHLVTDRPVRSQAQADLLAEAVAARRATRFIEAEGVCSGDPSLRAGAAVKIAGVGDRFSGTYYVTAAIHSYRPDQGYETQFRISGHQGASLLSLLQRETDTIHPPTLAVAVVTDNQDPEGQGRVKVRYPWLSGKHASDWARVAVPGGGPERGIAFLPEVNDEVLVGFEMGDIHQPYVLGGLWNGVDAPPKATAELVGGGKVKKRVMRSRTGHMVTLDDSDGGGGITIEDSKGNKIHLDTAKNALTIEVLGDATVKAKQSLTLEATGSVTIKGATVKVEGSGPVDIKGAVINLN